MKYTYFGVFFFFSSLHLWKLDVENSSVVMCKTQTLSKNQTILEIKLFSPNCVTIQGMEYTNFGVFFFFSSLHLWELEVENSSVVVCKTQLFCMLDIWFRLGREFKTMLGLRARRFVSTRSKLTNHPTITCYSAPYPCTNLMARRA